MEVVKMKEFIVLTGESVITEKIMQAESLEKLIEKISNTQRGKMEYQIYKNKPFNFENLLYTHHKKLEGIK
jgi:hypothetical protein